MTKEQKKEYDAKYYAEHKEQMAEYKKQYYQNNKEKNSEQVKQYRVSQKNNCVYMLQCNEMVYIGSTNWFYRRISVHKRDSIRYPNQKLYAYINTHGGWNNVKRTVLMDNIPFIELARKIEERWIQMIPTEQSLNTALTTGV